MGVGEECRTLHAMDHRFLVLRKSAALHIIWRGPCAWECHVMELERNPMLVTLGYVGLS